MTMQTEKSSEPDTPPPRRPGGFGSWLFGAWIGAMVVLLIVFAWLLGKGEGRRQAERATPTTQQAVKPAPKKAPAAPAGPGQQLFATTCGGCHTLAAANTHGTVGPNLDNLKPNAALVRNAIKIGGVGSGAMPKNLLQGQQAEQVAAFVSKAAGGGGG